MTIYQIVAKATYNNADEYRNVHHYEFAGYDPTVAEMQEAVDALDAAYKTNLQQSYPTALKVYAYDTRRVDVADMPTIEYIATAGLWNGTNVAQGLPTQVAALSTFKATTAFPRTSRTYHFPFTEAANEDGGQVSGAAQFLMLGWATAALELTVTGQLNADKVTVRYGGDPRIVTDWNEVTLTTANPRFATQRRRKIGVGA